MRLFRRFVKLLQVVRFRELEVFAVNAERRALAIGSCIHPALAVELKRVNPLGSRELHTRLLRDLDDETCVLVIDGQSFRVRAVEVVDFAGRGVLGGKLHEVTAFRRSAVPAARDFFGGVVNDVVFFDDD